MPQRTLPEYWTSADQAELELRAWEYTGTPRDDHEAATAAAQALVDWCHDRQLRSKAAWLRAHQDALDDPLQRSDWLLEIIERRRERQVAA